jgi:hypothetical protein
MPPKGKAKAKAKAGSESPTQAAAIEVPNPPPTPVCLRLPDGLVDQHATQRCLLLAWRDPASQYKLQLRPYEPDKPRVAEEVSPDAAASKDAGWVDAQHVAPAGDKVSRENAMLVTGLQSYHVEYRLACKDGERRINDVYVANWFSASSDPVATVVDPPSAPIAELFSQGDYANYGVKLTFGGTNKEFLQKVAGEEGPWAGWPGLGINKLQVRWRVLRRAASDGIRSPGPDLISKLANGEYRTSNMIEATASVCPFDTKSETWSYLCTDCPHGVVARFAVRVGTAYRWSPWSEESDDVDVIIAPPQPKLTLNNSLEEIQVLQVYDNGANLKWPGFIIPDGLFFVEYRVSVCLLKTKTQDPDWKEAPVVEIFGVEAKDSHEYRVKGLIPDSLYVFRVDARYPNIGDRGWSVPIMNSVPIRTEIPSRQPPGAPIPVPAEEVDIILKQEAQSTGKSFPLEEDQPWVMMLVESSRLEEYEIEFAPSTLITQNSEAGVANWSPPAETVDLGISLDENQEYTVVAVLLERAPADWSNEAFVCRLRHRNPSTVSPLLWTGSASTPVVPVVAVPEMYTFEPKMDVERGDFGIGIRFYLGSASVDEKIDAISAVKAVEKSAASAGARKSKRTTRVHRIGHRCVSHIQMRMRIYDAHEAGAWVNLRPKSIGNPKQALHDADVGAVPAWNQDKPPATELLAAAALLWDTGERYEAFLHQSDGLVPGHDYEISLRVGTLAQWSEWATTPSPIKYSFPLPRPPSIVGREGSLKLNMSASATVLMLKFPPFQMEPGLGNAEYVITAEPQFEEDLKVVPKNQRKQGRETGYTGLEGGKTVEKTLIVSQSAMKTDEQIMQHLVDKRLVQGLNDIADLSPILTQESGAEIDQLYGTDMQHVEVELSGLLPSTRYFVTVSARVAHLPDAPLGPSLTAAMETLSGSAPPAPPLQLTAPAVASIGSADRAVFLEFDDRTDYILEYRIADQGKAWYPQVQGGNQTSKRWWSTQEEGDWQIVPQMHSVSTSAWAKGPDGNPKKGVVCQVAELPAFIANEESLRANVQLPDVVELRLRVVDRSGAHPCRWLGSITKPMAVCFAPLVQRPFPKRVFSDSTWAVHISLFLFTRSCPPVKLVAQAREEMEESQFTELVDPEVPLAPGIPAPPRVEEDEGEIPVGTIPVGFGHKQVTRVQVRYRLVSATSDDMRDEILAGSLSSSWVALEGFDLTRCVFAAKSVACQGDRHVLKLSAEHGLQEGGVYEVQLRVGDEHRWSAWSPVSQRFEFEVPTPVPQEDENTIEICTTSASVVSCKWRPFVLAEGLSKVQYCLLAEPLNESQNGHGAAILTKIHEVGEESDGFWIETEMSNLVPATPYRFSISARYPMIGYRQWSQSIEKSIDRLEDLTADWPQLQAPVVLMHNGPRTFLQLEGETTMFHPSERAFLLAYPETRSGRDGISYRLEYKHVGLHLGNDQQYEQLWPVDYRSKWRAPVEVSRVDLPADKAKALEAFVPWKMPLRLWRVRLAPVPSLEDVGETHMAQMQRVQFLYLRAQVCATSYMCSCATVYVYIRMHIGKYIHMVPSDC